MLVYPSHMRLYMDKRYDKIDAWVWKQRLLKNNIRYENNCYINVKVLFKNVRVCVRVRPYLPFSTNLEYQFTQVNRTGTMEELRADMCKWAHLECANEALHHFSVCHGIVVSHNNEL